MNKLTWDELAKLYNAVNDRPAQAQPMGVVFAWAKNQKDKFRVDEEGYIYLK